MNEVRCRCAFWCGENCADQERMMKYNAAAVETESMPQSKPFQRKIVQIAVDTDVLYALCDDSTIWLSRPFRGHSEWEKLKEIP